MRLVLTARGFSCYEDFADTTIGEVVSRSSTTQTRRIHWNDVPSAGAAIASDSTHGEFYLKTYRYNRSLRRLAPWLDKGATEARNYRILSRHCGVGVPEVIAYGSRRRMGRLLDAFILTRAIPHAASLDDFAIRRWGPGRRHAEGTPAVATASINDPLRRYLLIHTADVVARMHAAGFFHVDLQWRNILIADDGSDRPRIFLIDSARGSRRTWRILQAHGRLRDLSSLYKEARSRLTPREQVRWLRRYFGVRRLTHEHRAIIQAIQDDRRIKDRRDPT
jgi:hypothetical protein